MLIEYDYEMVAQQLLDIDNIGDVCIELETSLHTFYFIGIKAIMGKYMWINYGPYEDVSCIFPTGVIQCEYDDFNSQKLVKKIKSIINNPKLQIVNARIIEQNILLDNLQKMTYNIITSFKGDIKDENRDY